MATTLSQRIRAYATEEEVAEIEQRASAAGLTLSNYVRRQLGLPSIQRGRPRIKQESTASRPRRASRRK